MERIRLRGRLLCSEGDGAVKLSLTVYFLGLTIVFLLPKLYTVYFHSLLGGGYIYGIALSVAVILSAVALRISLRLSFCRYFLRRAQSKPVDAGDLFYYLKPRNFISAAAYLAVYSFIKILCFFLCFFPSVALLYGTYALSEEELSLRVTIVSLLGVAVLTVAGGVCYSALTSGLFLCDCLFVKEKRITMGEIFELSQKMMKSNGKKLTALRFSFIGWFLLCLLVVPVWYVYPYYRQTMAVLANDIMKNSD